MPGRAGGGVGPGRLPRQPGAEIVTQEGNTTVYSTVYDVKELRITGVAVKLPGERERWKVFHHFRWVADPGWWGTEAIQLWPAWNLEMGWSQDKAVTGRLLCERDGRTWDRALCLPGACDLHLQ